MEDERCEICRRPATEWFIRLTIEDRGGFAQHATVCANCGVKMRLSSERIRELQIDPWVHEAVARVLRGRE